MHYLLLVVPLACVVPWLLLEFKQRNGARILLGVTSLVLVCGATWLTVALSWVGPIVLANSELADLRASLRDLNALVTSGNIAAVEQALGTYWTTYESTDDPLEAASALWAAIPPSTQTGR